MSFEMGTNAYYQHRQARSLPGFPEKDHLFEVHEYAAGDCSFEFDGYEYHTAHTFSGCPGCWQCDSHDDEERASMIRNNVVDVLSAALEMAAKQASVASTIVSMKQAHVPAMGYSVDGAQRRDIEVSYGADKLRILGNHSVVQVSAPFGIGTFHKKSLIVGTIGTLDKAYAAMVAGVDVTTRLWEIAIPPTLELIPKISAHHRKGIVLHVLFAFANDHIERQFYHARLWIKTPKSGAPTTARLLLRLPGRRQGPPTAYFNSAAIEEREAQRRVAPCN